MTSGCLKFYFPKNRLRVFHVELTGGEFVAIPLSVDMYLVEFFAKIINVEVWQGIKYASTLNFLSDQSHMHHVRHVQLFLGFLENIAQINLANYLETLWNFVFRIS